ncbi:MAG: tetratricopeptide repeat protein [Eubacterium sp.]|nr:tetratricopeptide repeat protein [Eubacterium sp.]
MGKTIRRLSLLIILLAVGLLVWQMHAYSKKQALRSDALLYFEEEDYAKSIQYLEDGLNTQCLLGGKIDRDMEAYLAESYFQRKDYEKARKLYHKLRRSDSNQSLYFLLEGECYRQQDQYDQALDIFQEGWDHTRDTAFLSKICGIYIEQNEYEKALDYARQGISDDGSSSSAELSYQLIIIYERSQDYEKAYEVAKEYCDRYPEDEKAKKELIFLSSRV